MVLCRVYVIINKITKSRIYMMIYYQIKNNIGTCTQTLILNHTQKKNYLCLKQINLIYYNYFNQNNYWILLIGMFLQPFLLN